MGKIVEVDQGNRLPRSNRKFDVKRWSVATAQLAQNQEILL